MALLRKEPAQTAQAPSGAKRRRGALKRILVVVLAAALVCGAGVGVKALFFSQEEQVALTGTTAYGSLANTIEGTGTTVPANSYSVTAASTEGEITAVYVSAGDTVKAGDRLYTQDDSELDDQLEEYQTQIDDLYDQISNYSDQIDSYNEQIAQLQETMSGLVVKAPFSGHVTAVSVSAEESVQKGTRLATLVDDSKMTLTEYFSYSYESDIYEGMTAGVSIPSLMNTYTGTVTKLEKVERLTAEGDRCFAVVITLDNPGALTEGMTGAAWLTADSGERIYPAVEGELKYCDSKAVTAQAAGDVLEVGVSDYERVSAGQTLFVIDGSEYEKQIESIQKSISSTQKNIASAQERIAGYQAHMAEVEEKRSDYDVVSEVDGKVIMVGVREGEKPRNGVTAVMVYDLDTMEITANIDELDIGNIQMGMEVQIVKSGTDRASFSGAVTEISYEATNTSGVAYFPITISIPANGALSAGVNVSYYITIGENAEGVLAPLDALKSTAEGTCLFVKADARPQNAVTLEDGVVPEGFYAVPVEVGATNSQYAVILSGVEEGAEVFTRYQQAAPANGNTTSQGEEDSGAPGGGMPNNEGWNGAGGRMPGFSGGTGGAGGGMPGAQRG